jgi:cysteine desulfurase
MLPFFREHYGNPASVTHAYGWAAAAAVKQGRERLAAAIGADPAEIIFTSGATESNNLAIKGVAEAYLHRGKHIVTVQTEHRAVLDPCTYLEGLGFDITRLPVNPEGMVTLEHLEAALRPDTILVSVMAANNEIGVLQPLAAIGQLCQERGIVFHSDAAQAIGKIPLQVQDQHLHLLSLTAHKVYGPKGIGALYVRRKNPRVQLAPQLHGGGQERGWRSGTLPVPLIVGFATAVDLALAEQTAESHRLSALRDTLWQTLEPLGNIYLNGHPQQRLPGNLNFSVGGVKGAALLLALTPHLALSSGSACTTAKVEPSHVLQALGRSPELSLASLRLGLGRFTTAGEVATAATVIKAVIGQLRAA